MSDQDQKNIQRRVAEMLSRLEPKNFFFRLFFGRKLRELRHDLANLAQIHLMQIELANLAAKRFDKATKNLEDSYNALESSKVESVEVFQ